MRDLFLIKDEKVGFLNIIVDENLEIAKFNFGRGFYCQQPELGRLEDYSLYHCGTFSVDGPVLFDTPHFVVNGLTAYNVFVNRVNLLNLSKIDGDEDA